MRFALRGPQEWSWRRCGTSRCVMPRDMGACNPRNWSHPDRVGVEPQHRVGSTPNAPSWRGGRTRTIADVPVASPGRPKLGALTACLPGMIVEYDEALACLGAQGNETGAGSDGGSPGWSRSADEGRRGNSIWARGTCDKALPAGGYRGSPQGCSQSRLVVSSSLGRVLGESDVIDGLCRGKPAGWELQVPIMLVCGIRLYGLHAARP